MNPAVFREGVEDARQMYQVRAERADERHRRMAVIGYGNLTGEIGELLARAAEFNARVAVAGLRALIASPEQPSPQD